MILVVFLAGGTVADSQSWGGGLGAGGGDITITLIGQQMVQGYLAHKKEQPPRTLQQALWWP